MKKLIGIIALVASGVVFAQNINSWQPPQMFGSSNYLARTMGSLVFKVNFYDGNIAPEIGSGGTFVRGSSLNYFDTLTQMAVVTSGNPATPSFPFNGAGTSGGWLAASAVKNWILYSEQFHQAVWDDVGSPTMNANTGTSAYGTTTADRITANGNDEGLEQDSGEVAASTKYVFSVFVSRSGGSDVAATLTLEGIGATPETTTQAITATSTLQRFSVYAAFTAAADGNCKPKITVDTSGEAIYVWAAQLEKVDDATYGGAAKTPSNYIGTTSSTGVTPYNVLSYPASNMTNVVETGSASIWVNPLYASTDYTTTGINHVWFQSDTFKISLGTQSHSGGNDHKILFAYGTGQNTIHFKATAFSANTWQHWVVTWDNSGAAINSQLYKAGIEVDTDTTTAPTTPSAATLHVGGRSTGIHQGGANAILSRFKLYDRVLEAAEALAIYDDEKGNYGI